MFEPYRKKRNSRNIAYQIACAQTIDLPNLANIVIEREGGEYQKIVEQFQQYLLTESAQLFIAKVDGEIVGFGKSRLFTGGEYQYEGWYLSGVIVKSKFRGCGIGRALTEKRVEALQEVTKSIYYFVNSTNKVSVELHAHLGFKLLVKPFEFPNVVFESGHGCLYVLSTNDL